jgi:polyisoprenoid-binding protein YceI
MAPTEVLPATEAPAAATTEAPVPTEAPAMAAGATVFTLREGTIARYKVEEVLANTGFKIATGETQDVAGSIAFDADGSVIAEESRIAVQAATLRTDSNRRDGYVRNRTLLTDTYPEVVFQPTLVDGLPASIADASGPVEFTITGDLMVRDQTREVTWDATADFPGDGTASGMASVMFTFDDFGMDKPRVAIVVSVEDEILLELDFVGTIMGP